MRQSQRLARLGYGEPVFDGVLLATSWWRRCRYTKAKIIAETQKSTAYSSLLKLLDNPWGPSGGRLNGSSPTMPCPAKQFPRSGTRVVDLGADLTDFNPATDNGGFVLYKDAHDYNWFCSQDLQQSRYWQLAMLVILLCNFK